ncbi:MAG: 16S rRNA (guanine(966)-N(2))-methyltransferase RsmD [Firmicutes bacterium]|nr:16S rRNA (guanine(966)-N(2))-methyltransferase RsmD [Bacillota bacterium]
MRIVAGDFKGRKLETPMNNDIRPTSEKVKEGLFSSISGNLYDAVCVDLFAGTGNLGLEALSRGASKCYFGDNSRTSIEIVRRNVAHCKAEDWSVVYFGDYEKVLHKIHEPVDIFFLDPPYREGLYEHCFELIADLNLLAEDGIIVAEHASRDEFPEEFAGFVKLKDRKYGSRTFSIYVMPEAEE